MKVLLDTHAVVWAAAAPSQLPGRVVGLLQDPTTRVLVSAVSTWEVAIKRRLGRLAFDAEVTDVIEALRFTPLNITHGHARAVEALPDHHADPFDRLLVAQAQVEEATLVTRDESIAAYEVPTIWN